MAYDSVAQCRDPNELFRRVESHLQRENREMIPRFFVTPIPSSEVVSIAWSVARWTWAHRQTLAKRERQTGIMELPKKPFLPKRAWMKEVTRRERLGQEYVAGQRKNETEEALLRAVKEIKNWEKQEKPTQKRVAELTGKNVRTVRRYWKVICALM
jgi:hypothetical protein